MANEPPSPIYKQKIDLMGSIKTESFSQRTATFLTLTHVSKTKTLNEPAPAPFPKPTTPSNPNFKQWKPPPTNWPEWVDQMAGKHSAVWIKSGILDPIMSSIYEIPCNRALISQLSHFWTPKTNTFVFPWGESTITLEDITILSGYSVLGESVNSVNSVTSIPDLAGKVETMNRFRLELVKSKSRKASHSKWIQMFMTNPTQPGSGHEPENEHIAFLILWLSRFVFPSGDQDSVGKHVIPIAVRLSQGVKLALAPAILAFLYNSLTRLKDSSSGRCVNLLGPFLLVQIWGYERFQLAGPSSNPKTPNELRPGEPTLARWHGLNPNVIDLESFTWRPYAVDLHNWKPPLYYQDSEQILSDSMMLDDDLRSFVRFITPCELNGLGCKATYHPHRVAMQFGFDQDIPGGDFGYDSSEFVEFFVPSRLFEPGVSKRYYDWWKNVDRTGLKNEQDSSLGNERMDTSMECGEFGVIEDGFDDILVSLKKICNDTKRKIDSLKESYVGVSQSKKEKLGCDVIIID